MVADLLKKLGNVSPERVYLDSQRHTVGKVKASTAAICCRD
jgi:hypothetical protein